MLQTNLKVVAVGEPKDSRTAPTNANQKQKRNLT